MSLEIFRGGGLSSSRISGAGFASVAGASLVGGRICASLAAAAGGRKRIDRSID